MEVLHSTIEKGGGHVVEGKTFLGRGCQSWAVVGNKGGERCLSCIYWGLNSAPGKTPGIPSSTCRLGRVATGIVL